MDFNLWNTSAANFGNILRVIIVKNLSRLILVYIELVNLAD